MPKKRRRAQTGRGPSEPGAQDATPSVGEPEVKTTTPRAADTPQPPPPDRTTGQARTPNVVTHPNLEFAVRTQAPPKVRKFLEKYGDNKIQWIQICRKPVYAFIQKAINFVRKFTGANKNADYDKLFHLYALIKLSPSGEEVKIERNQVFNITNIAQVDRKPKDGECRSVRVPMGTLAEIMKRASSGPGNWWRYHPINNNCQDAIIDLLKAGGVLTPPLKTFIKQDVSQLLPKFVGDVAAKVTDAAHTADIALEGNGRPMQGSGIEEKKRMVCRFD